MRKRFDVAADLVWLVLGGVAMVLTIMTKAQTLAHECALTALAIAAFCQGINRKHRDEE